MPRSKALGFLDAELSQHPPSCCYTNQGNAIGNIERLQIYTQNNANYLTKPEHLPTTKARLSWPNQVDRQ